MDEATEWDGFSDGEHPEVDSPEELAEQARYDFHRAVRGLLAAVLIPLLGVGAGAYLDVLPTLLTRYGSWTWAGAGALAVMALDGMYAGALNTHWTWKEARSLAGCAGCRQLVMELREGLRRYGSCRYARAHGMPGYHVDLGPTGLGELNGGDQR